MASPVGGFPPLQAEDPGIRDAPKNEDRMIWENRAGSATAKGAAPSPCAQRQVRAPFLSVIRIRTSIRSLNLALE